MTAGAGGGRFFHLVAAASWHADTADRPVALDQFERHGFVHCCFREQITEIATWWFDAGADLVALEIDPAGLTAEVRLEPSPTRWYPHVYGPVDRAAVSGSHVLPRSSDGATSLPPALASPPPSYRLVGRVAGRTRSVVWSEEGVRGDPEWIGAAERAVGERRPVELIGGVVIPATLSGAYESFSLLAELVDEVVRYEGDGFFTEDDA